MLVFFGGVVLVCVFEPLVAIIGIVSATFFVEGVAYDSYC